MLVASQSKSTARCDKLIRTLLNSFVFINFFFEEDLMDALEIVSRFIFVDPECKCALKQFN